MTTAENWRSQRRGEILGLFRDHVYGSPRETRIKLDYEAVDDDGCTFGGVAQSRQVTICVSANDRDLQLNLLTILPARRQPVPIFTLLNFEGNRTACLGPAQSPRSAAAFPIRRVLERGYGIATAFYGDICPDSASGPLGGARSLLEMPGGNSDNSWGAVGAWAWGLSRIMDYLVTDPGVNSAQVCLLGHSRLGKAALWAGAQDERFAVVISNNSGCTGAAISREKGGERVKAINEQFPHWFCDNYKRYNDHEAALPVDQHMLLALIAPRPLYVSSASEDTWADPSAEFRSCQLADPVYHLFGLQGIEGAARPLPEQPMQEGHIGYHVRTGSHGLHDYDWELFMDFADRHLKQKQ